jgi:hypothetical protein
MLAANWQARRESNPQPAVLETAALPIELLAFVLKLCLPSMASISSLTDNPARTSTVRALSGKKVHWTFFFFRFAQLSYWPK